MAREFVHPQLSCLALHWMLKRRQVPALAELRLREVDDANERAQKPFKDYVQALSISISSIFPRCRMGTRGAICT